MNPADYPVAVQREEAHHDAAAPMTPPRLTVISILYGQERDEILRLTRAVARSASLALAAEAISAAELILGNCGDPYPAEVADDVAATWTHAHVTEFGANLGHSAGCNRAVQTQPDQRPDDILLFLNPDALPAPRAFLPLVADLGEATVGAVDGRQIPFEHPKFFAPDTRQQSWASGACLATRREVFSKVDGFDPQQFWSYCNDVDLSWRIRLAGWTVTHAPDAVFFHDKRMSVDGAIEPTSSEDYYSTLGRLHLSRRFGQPAVEQHTLAWIDRAGSPSHRRAAAAFRAEVAAGSAPTELPDARRVAVFVGGEYGARRF